MDYETSLDDLNTNSVSVKTKQYVIIENVKYYVGEPHRCAYVNSTSDRAQISLDVPEPYLSAVMAVWGDTPTVTETAE